MPTCRKNPKKQALKGKQTAGMQRKSSLNPRPENVMQVESQSETIKQKKRHCFYSRAERVWKWSETLGPIAS